MNANAKFDSFWNKSRAVNAKQALATYAGHLSRTDLTDDERDFLVRAVAGQKEIIEQAKRFNPVTGC